MTAVFILSNKRRSLWMAWPRATGIFAGCLCQKSYKRPDFVVTETCDDPDCLVTEPCDDPDFTRTRASRSVMPPSQAGNLRQEPFHRKNKDVSSSGEIPGPEVSGPCRRRSGFLHGFSPSLAGRQPPEFAARITTKPDKILQEPDDRTTRPRQKPAKTRQAMAPTRGDRCAVTVIRILQRSLLGRRKSDILTTEGLCGPGPAPYSLLHASSVPVR
jgi:hypothetical protein